MKFLSFLNIRLAHEVLGCADEVLPYLFDQDQKKLFNTMVPSPPRGGKTTLLRISCDRFLMGVRRWMG